MWKMIKYGDKNKYVYNKRNMQINRSFLNTHCNLLFERSKISVLELLRDERIKLYIKFGYDNMCVNELIKILHIVRIQINTWRAWWARTNQFSTYELALSTSRCIISFIDVSLLAGTGNKYLRGVAETVGLVTHWESPDLLPVGSHARVNNGFTALLRRLHMPGETGWRASVASIMAL